MSKKVYESPKLQIIQLSDMDIIATSGGQQRGDINSLWNDDGEIEW